MYLKAIILGLFGLLCLASSSPITITCGDAGLEKYLEQILLHCTEPDGKLFCQKLYCSNVYSIPTSIGKVKSLTLLDLAGPFDTVPTEIGELTNLNKLSLSGTHVESFPQELIDLTNLQFLNVNSEAMKSPPTMLPDSITNLVIAGNLIEDIPDAAINSNLESLKLFTPNAKKMPKAMVNLQELTFLELYHESKSLPNLSKLTKLETLRIHNFMLKSIPKWIGNFENLRHLSIYAPIKSVPSSMKNLKNLFAFDLLNYAKATVPGFLFEFPDVARFQLLSTNVKKLPNLSSNIDTSLQLLTISKSSLDDISGLSNFGVPDLSVVYTNIEKVPTVLFENSKLSFLNLNYNKIKELPTEIGKMESLLMIHAGSNPITALPTEIGQLSSLQGLYFEGTDISTLPTEIGMLNPSFINLSKNKLYDLPDELSGITSLQLDYNKFSTFPRAASKSEYVFLNGNQISSIATAHLVPSCKIKSLNIADNRLSFVGSKLLEYCTNLKSVDLSDNRLHNDALPDFSMSQLQRLLLSQNQLWEVPSLPTTVTYLDLGHNLMTSMADFSSITGYTLLLSHNEIAVEALNYLMLPTRVKTLDLSFNKIAGIGEGLLKNLDNLNSINLNSNSITSLPDDFFDENSKLKELALSGNQLSTIPSGIELLPALQKLELAENNFDEIPSSIYDIPALVHLNISWNMNIKDISGLGSMSILRELDVSGLNWNLLTLPDISTFNLLALTASHAGFIKFPELPSTVQSIDLSYNNIKTIPQSLFLMYRGLKVVNLANNNIRRLPSKIFSMLNLDTNVKKIDLSGNKLNKIPSIRRMKFLTHLSLANNNLKSVPGDLTAVQYLVEVDLRGNKIKTFPKNLLQDLINNFVTNFYVKQNIEAKYPCEWAPYLRWIKTDLTVEDLQC